MVRGMRFEHYCYTSYFWRAISCRYAPIIDHYLSSKVIENRTLSEPPPRIIGYCISHVTIVMILLSIVAVDVGVYKYCVYTY